MIPTDIVDKCVEFAGAMSVLSGAVAAWWRKDGPSGDEVVSQAADVIIDAATDADLRNRIELHTGKNIGEQVTLEQMEDFHRERELRRMKNRN